MYEKIVIFIYKKYKQYNCMGFIEPPEYDNDGKRKVRVSEYNIKTNCDLGMFVGETIDDMYVDDYGYLIVKITEES